MTETEARETYAKYCRAIERNKTTAICKLCGDIKTIPTLHKNLITIHNKDGSTTEKVEWYVFLKSCSCVSKSVEEAAIKSSGTAQAIRTKTFESFKTDTAYHAKMKAAALNFIDDMSNRNWFVICGQSGCGKTHICTALMGELLKKGKRAKYMRWLDEVRQIKTDLSNTEVLNNYKTCEVLYIDDFFKGKFSEYDFNITFELINYRYSNHLITIISTERQPSELRQIDEALYSRIKEMSGKFLLSVNNDSNKNMRLTEVI